MSIRVYEVEVHTQSTEYSVHKASPVSRRYLFSTTKVGSIVISMRYDRKKKKGEMYGVSKQNKEVEM